LTEDISLKITSILQKLIVILCIFVLTSATTQPSPPTWANQWQANFHEEINDGIFGKGSTTGTLYFDWTNNLSRVDRTNGRKDRYCGTVKFKETPCSQIVVDDIRYIYYPELNYCCACCTKKEGCGLLLPTWIKNASYVGQTTLNKTIVDEWTYKDIQVFYYETPNTRVPIEIKIAPVDKIDFDLSSYKSDIADPSVFNLPSICKSTQKCPMSGCSNPKLQPF